MKKGYYITSSGEKVTLEATDTIIVSNKNIIELVLPEGIKDVYCGSNQLPQSGHRRVGRISPLTT